MDETHRSFRFPPFAFDPHSGELSKDGRPVKLHPQPAQVLTLLVRRAGDVLTREEIQKEVWGDETFVDFELGINSCIRQIRTALGDDAEKPRYVQTLPRRGYRFIAAVESVSREAATTAPEIKKTRRRLGAALLAVVVSIVLGGTWAAWHFRWIA